LSLAGLCLLSACQDAAEPVASAPQPIVHNQQLRFGADHPQLALLESTAAEAARDLNVELPARLVWNEDRTQRVAPAFTGRVLRVSADVGQRVSAGGVLAVLASPEFGAAQADTARAQADAQLSQKQLARQRELYEAGVVARKELEQAEADHARAQAEVARAQARTALYGSAGSVDQQLALRSELAGVVVERNLNPGQELRSDGGNAPLFVISDPTSLWVLIDAREADLADLQPGKSVRLNITSLPDLQVQATVRAVTDQIDPLTRTLKVRAEVANPQRLLKSEMLAKAHYERRVRDAVAVPASAVFLRGSQHYVFVQSAPGVFEPRDVKVFHEGAQTVLLSGGLKEGERVVSKNGLLLAREFRLAQDAAHAATEAGKP
jgi:cobalt-zinc-cadmium efflux system membrane fusion protein